MKLTSVSKTDVKAGDVLVFRGKVPEARGHSAERQTQYFYKLAIVVSVSEQETVLSPFTALWDDGDDDLPAGSTPLRVPKNVPTAKFGHWLARPVWETGDALVHRSRPARITETKANDLHVSIEYTDDKGGQFYGNLIWMDSSPTLNLLHQSTSWPALS
jgi:hypothetical protein